MDAAVVKHANGGGLPVLRNDDLLLTFAVGAAITLDAPAANAPATTHCGVCVPAGGYTELRNGIPAACATTNGKDVHDCTHLRVNGGTAGRRAGGERPRRFRTVADQGPRRQSPRQ